MAHFALLWKARMIEKYRLKYQKEKQNSIKISNAQNAHIETKTLYQRFCHMNYSNTKNRISQTFLRYYPKGSAVYNFFSLLKTDQTFLNFVMKSVIGFVGGIILTYLCFMFFVFQLSISLIHATIMSSVIGVLLTLGLAFSYRIRCLVFLLIPQFFSRVGRYTLTCYALVLILTGPATNTLKNSEVLSESLACAQEQLKTSMHQINQSIKKPHNSLKDIIEMMMAGVKQLAYKIKNMTTNLHRLTLSIAHSLQSSFIWLNSVVDSCNTHFGTPYDRCRHAVEQSVVDCQAILGPRSSWLRGTAKLIQVVCLPVKPLTAFCHELEYANGNILGVVTKNLNTFTDRINSMLDFGVHVHHSYSSGSNASRSANQVPPGIVTEMRNRADLMLTWLSWSSCVTSLSLLLIIFRAKYYQNMYETRSRFDNRYVTKELIDLDLKRLRHGKETVLPLNKREKGKYIKTTSFRLVSSERVHLSRSVVTMAITTFKLLIHMIADYSLYWVLMTIRHHGLRQTPLKPGASNAGIHVAGSSLISKILASLVETITLPLATPPPSTMTCLPNPHPPDFRRYLQIGILILLLWFFAMFEPYGLRLRHIIMGLYRPETAKARAVWLLNHIQRTRGSFLKFARRKLHREFKYSTERQHTFHRWLQDHVPCELLRSFLGIYPDDDHCVLCGVIEECNECDERHVWCDTPGCPGVYCTKCFSDIGQLCTICLSPADYGDLSDVSLVKDSSEESDDEDFKSCIYSSHYKKDDDDQLGTSKHQPQTNSLWPLSRKKKSNAPEEYPLLEREENNEVPNTNERKLSKAMRVRHKRYTDYDLQNKRLKAISLGEDTSCPVCQSRCEVCAIIEPVNSKINKVQENMRRASCDKTNQNNKHYETEFLNSSDQDDKYDDIRKFRKKEFNSKRTKHNLSIIESYTKIKQRFKRIRNYYLSRPHSHPPKRNRVLVLKLPSCLIFRQSSRKRKRRLITLSKSRSIIFNRVILFMSQKFCVHNTRSRKRRLKTKRRLRPNGFEHIVNEIFHRSRKISSTVVECDSNMDKCSDIYFDFDNGATFTYSPKNYSSKKCTHLGVINFPTGENVVQKQEPLIIKGEKENINVPKLTENRKSKRKTVKFFGTNCLNVRKIFDFVMCFKYLRKNQTSNSNATTNHKKRKKYEHSEKTKCKSKNDNEATRNYRIMTYLAGQDWMNERCATLKAKLAEAQNEQVDNLEEKLAETEVTTTMFKTNAKTNKTVHEYDDINYMPKIYKQKDTEKNSLDKSQKECQHKSEIELTKSCVQRNLGSYPSSKKYENVKLVRMKEPKNKTKNEVKSSNKWSILRKSGNVKTVKPNKKVTHGAKIKKNKVDAEVGVHPVVHNNYCQYVPIQDETTQVHVLKDQAQSMSQHSECMVKDFLKTLARRFFSYPVDCEDNEPKSVRNVAIYSRKSTKRKLRKEASTIHFNALKAEVEKETMTIQNPTRNVAAQWDSFRSVIYTDNNVAQELLQDFNLGDVPIFDTLQNVKFDNTNHEEKLDNKKTAKADMPPKYLKQVNQKAVVDEILPESKPPDTSSLGVFQSLSSLLREDSRIVLASSSYDAGTEDDDKTTDTTVYTLTNWGYEPPRQKKLAKYRWTLVTKSNMATATETPKCCDASTVTSDWWSPVLERKNKGFTLDKKEVQLQLPTPKTWQDRCVGTSARVVTFSSVAKIVPSMRTHLNLMSPSRYLLESQKYYNELFTTNSPFRSDYENNERCSAESRFSSHRSHVLKRKGFKKKRSEDSYTKLYSPFIEKVWSAKAVHRNPSTTVNPKKQRSPAKKNKEGLQAKGVTKTRHTPRFGFRKPELKIKTGQVNLVTRPYLSTENISLDNNYHSLTEISSL